MKRGDVLAIGYLILCAAIVALFPWQVDRDGALSWGYEVYGNGVLNFGAISKAHPFFMGFLKVGLLATFGEMIKMRGKTGSYRITHLTERFIVWGLYGLIFSVAFPLFDAGVKGLMNAGLWYGTAAPATMGAKLWLAFSCSFLTNMIFAFPMMLSHEWFNFSINQQRLTGGAEFWAGLDKQVWGSFIPKSIIVFWIPAHTITFSLPGEYRILMAAALGVALGFLLTFKPKKTTV